MKKMVKLVSLVAAMLMIVVCFAGCSSTPAATATAAPAESAAPASAAPAESTAPEATPLAGTPNIDAIKSAGKLIMLTEATFAPYEYLGDKGDIVGIDVDIATRIAKEIGVELEVINMNFDGIVAAIQSGSGDLGCAAMSILPERIGLVDFSNYYVDAAQYMIVKKDSAIKTSADLEGKKIGVQKGTTGDFYASDNVKDAQITRYTSTAEAAMDLANGNLDAIVIDDLPADAIIAQHDDMIKIDEKLTEEQYAIAIGLGKEDLKAVVNKVLADMTADGTLAASMAEHIAVYLQGK